MHLDGDDAVALAGFTPTALHVEGEAARSKAALARLGHHREEIADEREQPGVGGGIRAWSPPDRRLVDLDNLVDQLDALDTVVCTGFIGSAIERLRKRAVEDVVHQRRLARTAHARDGREHADRHTHVNGLQVVLARASNDDLAFSRPAARRRWNGARTGEVGTGDRCGILHQIGSRALEDHLATMLTGSRPEIDHPVRRTNGFLVVLDDDDGVAKVAQLRERVEQLSVVALMQSDGRLVKDIEHTGQVRADLSREPDALPFSARQRCRASTQGQIADADLREKSHTVLDLAKNALGDDRFAVRQPQPVEHRKCFGNRQLDVVRNRASLDAHGQTFGLEAITLTCRAWPQ